MTMEANKTQEPAQAKAAVDTVSVIIVNYNTREATTACIESVLRTTDPEIFSIIVVDNGSSDGSVDAIGRAFPSVRVVESGGNIGFGRAVNVGVREATGDYVLLLNPDTVALPVSLNALRQFARVHTKYGVYGGRTLTPELALDPHSCWGKPTLWSTFCFGIGLSTFFAKSPLFDPESLGSWKRNTVREVDIVTGCLLLMKRSDFVDIGGMDERYFLYGEDAEFSIRARSKGFKPVLVPDAVIVHENGGSSTSSDGSKLSMVMAGKVTLFHSTWTPQRARLGVSLLVLGTLLRATLEIATGRKARPWGGVWKKRSRWIPGYPEAEELLFGSTYSQGS